jgi:hypothetical protein
MVMETCPWAFGIVVKERSATTISKAKYLNIRIVHLACLEGGSVENVVTAPDPAFQNVPRVLATFSKQEKSFTNGVVNAASMRVG